MKAMILTAGLGTRFRPHTDKLAKPALPFLNVPLLGYSLFHIESLGITDLVMNLHHLPETVRKAAGAVCNTYGGETAVKAPYKIHFSDETSAILGSGGGIRKAESFLRSFSANGSGGHSGGHFLVANGDEVMFFKDPNAFKNLVDTHKSSGAIATLLTTEHPAVGVSLNGLRVNAASEITEFSIREKGLAHFTGVFVFSDKVFDYMPKSGDFHIFKDVLIAAIKRGEKVRAHHVPSAEMLWFETGSEKEYIESTASCLKQLNEESAYSTQMHALFKRYGQSYKREKDGLWLSNEGVHFEGALEAGSTALIGAGAKIGKGVQIKGFGVIGPDTQFDNGVIEHSVVAPGLQVHEMVALRHQLLL